MYTLSDYNYTLPEHLIAQKLASPADSAKLLVFDTMSGSRSDHIFYELPSLLEEGSHLFFNTSKVVKARIPIEACDGEIFFLEQHTDLYTFDALVRPGKKMKVGQTYTIGIYTFEVIGMTEQGRTIQASHPIFEVLESIGQMPLPPYIGYDQSKSDSYQPLQAKHPGSVAAPTASLHFTQDTFAQLKSKQCRIHEVVLHIGLGTFKQVDVKNIEEYDIHSERAQVSGEIFRKVMKIKQSGKPLVAVGTTVTRTLETLPYLRLSVQASDQARSCFDQETTTYRNTLTQDITLQESKTYVDSWTIQGQGSIQNTKEQGGYDVYPRDGLSIQFESTLYIYPGFDFQVIDQLITNFHLPKSSLLMLVAGFIGYDQMLALYQYAIKHEYMFYSFGDGMLLK